MRKGSFRSILFVFVLTLLSVRATEAQKSVSPFSSYTHNVWETKDGLPQNSVNTILQSKTGYIWFGTQEGLVRFDGIRFTVFDRRNTPELKARNIISLREGRDTTLWIGTDGGGLTSMKNGIFRSYTIADGLSDNTIRVMVEDGGGVLWLGTSRGLASFANGVFTSYADDDAMTYSWVSSLLVDREGRLVVGTNGGGLYRSTAGAASPLVPLAPMMGNLITALAQDSTGVLWVGAERGTLIRLTNDAVQSYSLKGVRSAVSAILIDHEGSCWVGTEDGVLAQFIEPDSLQYFSRTGSAVTSLLEDREGSLWVGRYSEGLHRLKRGQFTTYTTSDGLPDNFVGAICPDGAGGVYAATRGGLSRYSRGTFTTYANQEDMPIDGISALQYTPDGAIWIGTPSGLSVLWEGKYHTVFSALGRQQKGVRGIASDRDGILWIASRSGLMVSKQRTGINRQFHSYGDSAGILLSPLWGVYAAKRSNELWLATVASGLIRVIRGQSGDRIRRYTVKDGLSSQVIRSVYEDSAGVMWFGTYSGGLIRYNGERFVAITAANGLFDDNVFAIVEDRAGFLWMSCNRGVFKVRKGMLNEFADGKIKSITGRSYGTAEGMRTFECNGGTQLSGCATTDGRLWFATADGFATIEPLSGDANTTPPPVVIEKALIDRKQIAVDTPADVEPGNGDLEFTYTALSFVAPDRVAFKYRLEGFDEEWVDAGNRRLANYTNIPPGTYTFRVIAANNDGVWNESGATLTFTLSPHFYQAIWFYAVAVLSIGLLGSLVYHFYRTYRDRAKVAERLAAQLAQAELQVLKMQLQPHFLFNTLHAISSLMHSDLDAADEMMARLGSLLRYTLESNGAQEVPLRQELVMLDHYLEIEQIRLADRLRVQMNIPSELHDVSVPNLILQPIVENAIRYGIAPRTTGGHMEITATRVGSDIRLQICDDGPGLDDRMREGVGLSNTRARLEQMYGARQRFSYANRPQGGMCVSMEFPIIRRIHDNGEAEHHEGIPDSHAHH